MACPHCAHSGLVSITMSVRGDGLVLHSCSVCEKRWWVRGDRQLSLDEVLALAAA